MARQHKNLEFNFESPIQSKLFTHKRLAETKLEYLAKNIKKLEWGEVTWLSRIEDFYRSKDYITETQLNVLHGIFNKYQQIN